jgi:hypothetical protein
MKKHFIELAAVIFQNAGFNLYAVALQIINAPAGNKRIGINCADNNAGNFMLCDTVYAGRRFPFMATWF